MNQILIPPDVSELLDPISAENAAGTDPEMSAEFISLEAEMSKMGEINYPESVKLSRKILKEQAKHFKVVGWLCLSWLRTEGISGLKKGLILTLELIKKYQKQLLPEDENQLNKAIQYLNKEKRIQLALQKVEINDENVQDILEIQNVMTALSEVVKNLFPTSPPSFENLTQIIDKKSKSTGSSDPGKESAEPTSKEEPVIEKPDEVSEQKEESETQKEPESQEVVNEKATDKPDVKGAEEKDAGVSEKPVYDIPPEVVDLLNDISADMPAGEDVENSTDQELLVVYMNLETEISKYSGNDYESCMHWARKIIGERSKHLRVTLWYLIAWFRKESLVGFKNGLMLLTELLKKYGEKLYPENTPQKTKIIQLLNTDTRIKILEKIEVNADTAKDLIEIGQIFDILKSECQKLFPDSPPKLNQIQEIIEEKSNAAKAATKPSPRSSEADTAGSAEKSSSSTAPVVREKQPAASSTRSMSAGAPVELGTEIEREKDAQILLKKAILFYFQEGPDEAKKRKVPDHPSVYGLSRMFRWGKLNLPPNADNVTQIEAPNQPKQNLIMNLLNSKDFDTLIPEIEVNFLNREDFLYWLDAQFYVVQALEQKGGSGIESSKEIKFNLARLLERLPALPKLLFKDKKTPFASKDTLSWIEDDVKLSFGNQKPKEKILPPIIGEEYDEIGKFYEKACEELPENFEKNVKEMQVAIAGDTRLKGKFLRLLNLANYCYVAKKYSIAKVLFNELMDKIDDYKINEWEKALCVAVWQSTYLNNIKLLETELKSNQREEIDKQQVTLFGRIGKYDSVLALSLSDIQQNKGE
ncbi:MAG: type VI secretion system domain-containing protein [bacterium]|nr:MAG: type VI secretion system domain-containing protein [bacterium]